MAMLMPGQPAVYATNPYTGGKYWRRPPPWSKVRGGKSALSERQQAYIFGTAVPEFRKRAKGGQYYEECRRDGHAPGTIGINKCMNRKIGNALRRTGGARPQPQYRPVAYDRRAEYEYAPYYRTPGQKVPSRRR